MSNYFSNAREFTLNNPNFSNVEGDQYIYNTYTTTVTTAQHKSRLRNQGNEEEEGEFEQYYEVKRADVELNRTICSHRPDESWRERRFDCEKTFFAGEIARGDGQSSGLMVVGYEGREAQEAWLEDFRRTTGFLSVESAHLLAISRSLKIPLLIFTRELVPAKHFLDNVGELGRAYFMGLSKHLRCHRSEVWMDPQRGVLCRGPGGPSDREWQFLYGFENIENVPLGAELLQEDVCRRFLAGFKSVWADRIVIGAFARAGREEDIDLEFTLPTVISPLTDTPIASAVTRWYDTGGQNLGVSLGNELNRFTLDDPPAEMSLLPLYPQAAWLSQAQNFFRARGLSLEDDLSEYKLIVPHIRLKLSFSQNECERRRRRQQPIYLFIRPLPSTPLRSRRISSLHYWSFNEDGQSPLPADMHHHLGLPIALELTADHYGYAWSWSNDVYKRMHEYQVARGFDPQTTDFARSLGHLAFNPIHNDSDRFEEVAVIEGIVPPAF